MKKILTIDDQQDNLTTIEAVIKSHLPGCEVITALSGPEGIKLAIQEQPDTIILDIIMPGMDGYEVCEKLKEDELTRHIPVIMLTAIKTDSESRVKGLNTGADAFLSKPIDPVEFSAQINVMLRIKEAEDKLREEKKDMESVILDRTKELRGINEDLKLEILERRRAEDALGKSEIKLKMLVYNIPGMVYRGFPDWSSEIISGSQELCGYSAEELISNETNWLSIIHPDDKEWVVSEGSELTKGQKNIIQTYRIITKKGDIHWVEDHKISIFSGGGNFLGIDGILFDITERKLAEERLKISEERFRQIVENSHEWIWEVDLNGLYTFASHAVDDMLGYKPEELIGKKHFYDLFPPEDREEYKNAAFEVFRQRQSFREFINRNVNKSGEIVWLSTSGVPMLDDDGNLSGYRGADINITERKLAEEKLKEQAVFVQQNPAPVFSVNDDGVIIAVNRAAHEISEELKTGKSVYSVLKNLTQSSFNILVDNEQIQIEETIGSKTYLFTIKKDSATQAIYFFGSNISQRKIAEQDLKIALKKATETDRLKSAFLATMSHELRTPLNAIIGFSDIIDDELSIEDIISYNNNINSSGNHLLSLVEDIFDITLIESGEVKIIKEDFQLQALLNDVQEIVKIEQQKTNKGNITLSPVTLPDSENLFISTDPSRLRQILINLLKNAMKFTHEGHINYGYSFETDCGKPMIRFYVEDTGIGIPEDKQELIFDIFRQVEDSYTRSYGGTGLGLSISKKLTGLLGGKIWLESEEGVGSTFYFTIPFDSHEDISKPVIREMETKISIKDKTILIVEDDESSFEFLQVVLERLEIDILWAKNGEEAIKFCIENDGIELVLMDINMPVMNGYDATREIKKFRPDLPIIAQTAYAIAGDR
nr:PAS domain S-box protein [Bacteroidota bacterium]